MFSTTLLNFSNSDFLSFFAFESKIDFLVIKITNFTHKSGYLGKVGALGSKLNTPKLSHLTRPNPPSCRVSYVSDTKQ
jgi:hypothetical protein